MSAHLARTSNILNEPGFEYKLQPWGDSIYGTPEQLQRIGIGLDIHFPERVDGRWKRKCIDPRGFEVLLSAHYSGDGRFHASISCPGRVRNDETPAKPFAPGVELREGTWRDAYIGTADALVAAGIVPAGHFPGWPGMAKTLVRLTAEGALTTGLHGNGKSEGTKEITTKSKGKQPTYKCSVHIPYEVGENRRLIEQSELDEWKRRINAMPRPKPLIDLPGMTDRTIKVKPAPKYRTDGNVIHLAPRSEWRAAL